MSCDAWINLSIAISTFLAVIVALFGEQIHSCWFDPKLSVELADNIDRNTKNTDEEFWYYHLVVSNQRKTIANNAIVMITQIEEPLEGGTRSLWRGEVPLTWMFGRELGDFSKNIGAKQYCDIVMVGQQSGSCLGTLIQPNNMPNSWTGKINITITVCVKSEQCTTEKKIIVNWDGKWDQDEKEMEQHLKVKLLP